MRNRSRIVLLAALGASLLAAGLLVAQEQEGEEAPEMDAMMAAAAPGAHHEHLQKVVGNWKFTAKLWMDPSQPPSESGGEASFTSVLGGRFVHGHHTGNFLGMEFVGFGIEGYDNVKKKHVGVWADNFGTMIMTFEGNCHDGGKVVTNISAPFKDPMSGMEIKMKGVTELVDDDTFTYTAYMIDGSGNETKSFAITYKRV